MAAELPEAPKGGKQQGNSFGQHAEMDLFRSVAAQRNLNLECDKRKYNNTVNCSDSKSWSTL